MLKENELSHLVIGLALEVHTSLGPGLLERSYQECLYHKICKAGIIVEKQKAMPIVFEEVRLECGYRLDLLVENKLVVEIKSVLEMNEIYFAQTLTYLRLGNYKLGLLINFNVLHLKDGIRRVVNRLCP
jgi:GxxExxY protein